MCYNPSINQLEIIVKKGYRDMNKALRSVTHKVDVCVIGGGIVSITSGCSSMTPSDKTQTMGVYAFGIPGIAVITQSHQTADNAGSDTNAAAQSNPVSVDTRVK